MTVHQRLAVIKSRFLHLDQIQKHGLPFREYLMFGAGHRGRLLRPYFESLGANVVAFIDNNREMQGHSIDSLKVFSLGDALNTYPETPVFIASSHLRDIAYQLQQAGISDYYGIPYLLPQNSVGFYQPTVIIK